MKSLYDWKREKILEALSLDDWYKNSDKKSYQDWKLKRLVEHILNEQVPPPGMDQGQAPPMDPAGAGPGAPPDPSQSQPNAAGNVPPIGQPQQPQQQQPDQPPQPDQSQPNAEDEDSIVNSLSQVLGEQDPKEKFALSAALKQQADAARMRAEMRKLDPGAGLKMWLRTCVDAWKSANKKMKSPPQQQPQQPQQPGPGAPGPAGPAPGAPGPAPGAPGPAPGAPAPGM